MANAFCITKTVENVQITLHQDYQGNARVVIGENYAINFVSTYMAPVSYFLDNGWTRVSELNKIHFPQKGAYVGNPRAVQYLELPEKSGKIKAYNIDENGKITLFGSNKLAQIILKEVQKIEAN